MTNLINQPYRNLLEYSIEPIGNPIEQSFESDIITGGGVPINAIGVITLGPDLNLTNPTYSVTENSYFLFNGQRIYFKPNPSINEMPLTGDKSTGQRLFQILSENPYLSSRYIFQQFDISPTEKLISQGSRISGLLPLNLTDPLFYNSDNTPNLTLTSIFFNGIDTVTGQVDDWGTFLQIIHDPTAIGLQNTTPPFLPIEFIILTRSFLGFDDSGNQKPLVFDVSLYQKQFLEITPSFNSTTFHPNATSQYFLKYGEQQNYIKNFNGENLIRNFTHISYTPSTEFQSYQDRLPSVNPTLTPINFLTNRNDQRIEPTQTLHLSVLWHYVPFDLFEPPYNFQPTNLQISYDVTFEDGSTTTGSYPTTLALQAGEYTFDVSLFNINYTTLENTANSLIRSITLTLNEYLPIDTPLNSRAVTNPITFYLNNDLRCYQNDDSDPNNIYNHKFGELYWLNSLGGQDQLFTHESIVTSTKAANSLYEYGELDREVFKVATVTQYTFTSDWMQEHEYLAVTDLLKSNQIYFRTSLFSYTPVFITENSWEYDNQTTLHRMVVTLEFKKEENNLTR